MIFVIFSIYTMNPLSLRVSCVICVILSAFHVILTAVVAAVQRKACGQFGALETEHPGISARQVCMLSDVCYHSNLCNVEMVKIMPLVLMKCCNFQWHKL